MKRFLFVIASFVLISGSISAQGPNLNLVGSGSVITKGTVSSDMITQVVQDKQEELRQKVFRDIVVAEFEKGDPLINNFTVYYYIYNVMKTITTEKNKTIITRNLMHRTSEFTMVYWITAFSVDAGIEQYSDKSKFYTEINNLFPKKATSKENEKVWGTKNLDTISTINIHEIKSKASNDGNSIEQPDLFTASIFNFLIDMSFDVLINYPSMKDSSFFKDRFDMASNIRTWYNSDNEYIKRIAKGGADSISATILHNEMNKVIKGFLVNYDNYKTFDDFAKNMRSNRQGMSDITLDQYLAMSSLLREAIEIIRLNFDNSIVTNVTGLLLDYTIVEYKHDADSNAVLYVDIESLISALDQLYNNKARKSSIKSKLWYINPSPLFTVGVNHALFVKDNTLLVDNQGYSQQIKNLYYASEKIGIKIKFCDWKYSRSFEPGERFKYKGVDKVWVSPKKQSTISDIHFLLYGSGLLYNLTNLKSNEDFDYALAGAGIGITFYDGLSANLGFGCPISHNKFNAENIYFNIGFEVPILDYIAALRKK